ncbi:MAG: hypothetical protein AB9836_12335 [Aminipila sp.]
MVDIDKYMNIAEEFVFKGKKLHVKQPSAKATKEIGKLETAMNEDNALEMKCKITQIVLNNNEEGVNFAIEEVEEIPFKVQDVIIRKITEMKMQADNDPN